MFPPALFCQLPCNHLREVLWCVALIRGDDLAIHELLVGIGRVDDGLAIDNGQGLEAVVGSELAAPVAADGVGPALLVVVGDTGRRVTDGGVGAGGCGRGVGVNGEGVLAGGVGGVASADEGLDGPLRSGCGHHGFLDGGRCGHGRESGHGCDENGLELHCDFKYGALCAV